MKRLIAVFIVLSVGMSVGVISRASIASATSLCNPSSQISLKELEANPILCAPDESLLMLDAAQSISIPRPGTFVEAQFLSRDGGKWPELDTSIFVGARGETLAIVDGKVYGDEALLGSIPDQLQTVSQSLPPAPNGCMTNANSVGWAKWTKSMQWWYAPKYEPSSYARNRYGSSLQTWVRGISRCTNYETLNQLSTAFQGNSSLSPSISSNGDYCLLSEGKSIVGWKPMPLGLLGVTCTWGEFLFATSFSEADIALNSNQPWYFPENGSMCASQFNMQQAATHEFGHSIGLGHVDESYNQIMGPSAGECELTSSKLGLGDLTGLLNIYGF